MSLRRGQVAKLCADIGRQVDYLRRLTVRIEREQFPTRGEMRVTAIRARREMERLLNSIPIKPLRNAT